MFNIGWGEYLVIAVIALIAIGPKELPGVLRMAGQWIGKARKMAAEFQGQFQEAMREAEMADLKKSFDEVREAATGFASGDLMTSLHDDVKSALTIPDTEKPASPDTEKPASTTEASPSEAPVEVAAPVTDEATPEQAVTAAATPAPEPDPAVPHDTDREVKAS